MSRKIFLLVLGVIFVISGYVELSYCACPAVCKCDAILAVVRCVGRRLVDIPNPFPPDTVTLILQWNIIKFSNSTTNASFVAISQLKHLDLSRNNIAYLPHRFFDPLVELEELHLDHNEITSIDWDIFGGLLRLRRLYLNRNAIATIHTPDRLREGMPFNMELLYLSDNKLEVLTQDTFISFSHIDTLYLNDNSLTMIDSNAFDGIVIKYLNLGANELSTYGLNIGSLTSLQQLVIYGNKLTLNNSAIFHGLSNLMSLTMSQNEVTAIDSDVFKSTPKLENLFLEGNNVNLTQLMSAVSRLYSIQGLGLSSQYITSFPYWICDLFINLTEIHITNSNLQALTRELSTKCGKLTVLNLNLNEIAYIEPYTFANITFQYLYLQSNKISKLSDNVFKKDVEHVNHDMNIYLDMNPINCNCNWESTISLPRPYVLSGACVSPAELQGRAISSLTSDELYCEPTTAVVMTTRETTQTTRIPIIDENDNGLESTVEPDTTVNIEETTSTAVELTTFVYTTVGTTIIGSGDWDDITTSQTLFPDSNGTWPTSVVPGVREVIKKGKDSIEWVPFVTGAICGIFLLCVILGIVFCCRRTIQKLRREDDISEKPTFLESGKASDSEKADMIYIMENSNGKPPMQTMFETGTKENGVTNPAYAMQTCVNGAIPCHTNGAPVNGVAYRNGVVAGIPLNGNGYGQNGTTQNNNPLLQKKRSTEEIKPLEVLNMNIDNVTNSGTDTLVTSF